MALSSLYSLVSNAACSTFTADVESSRLAAFETIRKDSNSISHMGNSSAELSFGMCGFNCKEVVIMLRMCKGPSPVVTSNPLALLLASDCLLSLPYSQEALLETGKTFIPLNKNSQFVFTRSTNPVAQLILLLS